MGFSIVNDPNVISSGGTSSSGLTENQVKDIIEGQYINGERILATYQYNTTFSGLDFPNAWSNAKSDTSDIVVRFHLGQTYTSTTYLDLRLYQEGNLATSHWYVMDGFQSSTSADSNNATATPYIRMNQGSAFETATGKITFPQQTNSNLYNQSTYPSAVHFETYTPTRNANTNSSWGFGGVQSSEGDKITGFRLMTSAQFGNASYQLGRTTWMDTDAYVIISEKPVLFGETTT